MWSAKWFGYKSGASDPSRRSRRYMGSPQRTLWVRSLFSRGKPANAGDRYRTPSGSEGMRPLNVEHRIRSLLLPVLYQPTHLSFGLIRVNLRLIVLFARPGFRNCFSLFEIIDDQDQLIVVIAVKDFDVDAGFGHQSSDLSELAWLSLVQALNQHLSLSENADACGLQRRAGGCSVFEEEVSGAIAVDDKGAAALDAYARASHRFAHFGQRTRSVFQSDC